jgi:decaprenylphospho-beta-D-ribofuranose 2-oxidase
MLGAQRSLCGWGRTSASRATVMLPGCVEDVQEALAGASATGVGVIARGAGRSYGDAAQSAGGVVLDMTGLDRILSTDRGRLQATAQAGVTLAQLAGALAADGLALPVLPGTRHVTVAGAVASDIHGKNHHRDGGLARHVASLSLCTPGRGLVEVSPENERELFYATLGGMGLTGVIVQAILHVERVASPWLAVDADRTDGLEQTLELMAREEHHRYSVAWMDLLADGGQMGRAIVSRADNLPAGSVPERVRGARRARQGDSATLSRTAALTVPPGFPGGLLRPAGVRMFNAIRWRVSPRRERARPVALAPYFFPLDGLGAWNRLYGPAGLVQYQFVIPRGEDRALRRCFELIRIHRLPVYLAVFKRLGDFFGGPLSFALDGWTLAIDVPAAAPQLPAALRELDELVAGCGGRVYLTKDARMAAEMLPAMYPRLDLFQAQRDRADPERVLSSDLSARLGLCGAAA